jgi:hypothetical protein
MFVELVYHVLYLRHINNEGFITSGLRYYEGIAGLAARNAPLWIFSLNHDLMIECIAARYGIPTNAGFTGTTTLPRRDPTGAKIGDIEVDVITEDELKTGGMSFWQPGQQGINLLKIHGALDLFAFREGKDLLRLRPTSPDAHGVIDSLRIATEELLYIDPG